MNSKRLEQLLTAPILTRKEVVEMYRLLGYSDLADRMTRHDPLGTK
jgi:hypothetical protein